MTRDTRITLLLMGELVAALLSNDADAFKCCLSVEDEEVAKPHPRGTKNLGGDWLFREQHTQQLCRRCID